jgi:hypothetical protein
MGKFKLAEEYLVKAINMRELLLGNHLEVLVLELEKGGGGGRRRALHIGRGYPSRRSDVDSKLRWIIFCLVQI